MYVSVTQSRMAEYDALVASHSAEFNLGAGLVGWYFCSRSASFFSLDIFLACYTFVDSPYEVRKDHQPSPPGLRYPKSRGRSSLSLQSVQTIGGMAKEYLPGREQPDQCEPSDVIKTNQC
jgi:hypothetical protein